MKNTLLILAFSLVYAAAAKPPVFPVATLQRVDAVIWYQTDTNNVAGWNLTVGTNVQFVPFAATVPPTNGTLTCYQNITNVPAGTAVTIETVDVTTQSGVGSPSSATVPAVPASSTWVK